MDLPPPYRVDWFADEASAAAANDPTHYPVVLTDGSRLSLPLTPLPGGEKAVALLMSNQTDFEVERKIRPLAQILVRRCAVGAGDLLHQSRSQQTHLS